MLEAASHQSSIFVTLTFDKDNFPKDGSVDVRDVQLFMKRLRKAIAPAKVRYYAVGEYGDLTMRPHYHIVLFGLSSTFGRHGTQSKPCSCLLCSAWSLGFVHVGEINRASLNYILGYVLKRFNKGNLNLEGRKPEFATMSTVPPIGGKAAEAMADQMLTKGGSQYVASSFDVATTVRFDGSIRPIGRTLSRIVRKFSGFSDFSVPKQVRVLRRLQLLSEINDVRYPELLERRRYRDELRARASALRRKSVVHFIDFKEKEK